MGVCDTVCMQRKLGNAEPVNIEIDGQPACAERLLKKVIENSKQKVYDRINVSWVGHANKERGCVIV